MVVGPTERLEHVGAIHVVGARHERGLRAQRQRQRIERGVERTERRRLRDLADFGRRRVLALRQSVDLVVEQQDLDVDVAAQRVDQVVAADRQRIAVARHDPHVQIRSRHRQTGRDRGSAAVDAVHPVRVHVVREASRATDARHEHGVFAPHAEVGHEHLHRREDRVVAATGAPTHFLVARPVLAGRQRNINGRHRSNSSKMACSSSPAVNGWPLIFVTEWASTRKSDRMSFDS